MLTRLRVDGFKNLIGVDLPLGPFTCIAGANAVGKSNLFDAILFLRALMDRPIMDAAMAVRDERSAATDIRHLFTQTTRGSLRPIRIEVEMLVPSRGQDYLDQPAEAKTTFLVYKVELCYRSGDDGEARPRIELVEEALEYIKRGDARSHLPFPHARAWRDSVVTGRRTSPFISTEDRSEDDPSEGDPKQSPLVSTRVVKLHQDSEASGGRTRLFHAEKLPRTVLSTVNAQESPTAVIARQEMLNWRLLQLEPTALRMPDGFDAPSQLDASGAHLPATLYRLAKQSLAEDEVRRAGSSSPASARTGSIDDAAVLTEVANRLCELIDHVGRVRIDRDEKRELLTLRLTDKYGTELPAKALSDGTLRFLALAGLEIDPTLTGLICMEEPENGIHPERIGAMLTLLQDIAVDTSDTVGDDNPLRQVVINTHSPVVVGQVPDDAVVFAIPQEQAVQGTVIKGVSFRCLADTWRAKEARMPEVAKGKALAFLSPIAEPRDTRRKAGERRVVDREDMQLSLDL